MAKDEELEKDWSGSDISDLLMEILQDDEVITWKDVTLKALTINALVELGNTLDEGEYSAAEVPNAIAAYETLDDLYLELSSDIIDDDELEEEEDELDLEDEEEPS